MVGAPATTVTAAQVLTLAVPGFPGAAAMQYNATPLLPAIHAFMHLQNSVGFRSFSYYTA